MQIIGPYAIKLFLSDHLLGQGVLAEVVEISLHLINS